MFTQVLFVLLLDLLFVGLFVLALTPLAIYRKASFAVLKRDFVSYFSTPTGYVFWFLFVLLCSFAAFWPHEFFTSNMATLDQLNFWFPIIMVLFIPAITMGIWAEERRQGTDELLLTMPADDLDIVIGKYLAAAAIFTVSLLFSQLANFSVLNYVALGGVDLGLFFTTYLGYWFMGMAMLAIGMVASFLTRNLTVGFVLGVVLNAPLAVAHYADVIISDVSFAQTIGSWGMAEQFADFSRGVVSTSSVMYFVMLIVIGLYLCMVLIGRRHWSGGKDGQSILGHYLLRIGALVVIMISATVLFTNRDVVRYDATSERISSLSPDSYRLIRELDFEEPVRVEAYISKSLPDSFVRTKYDLKNLLRELQAIGGNNIQVSINENLDPYSEDAKTAEDTYGITAQSVQYRDRGAQHTEEIHLAAAFTSGMERVVIPFFGLGAPIEYELVHAIVSVADANEETADGSEESTEDQPNEDETDPAEEEDDSLLGEDSDEDEDQDESNRKVVGILGTDAQLTGGLDFRSRQQIPERPIITELRKQYEVRDVAPGDAIDPEEIDVLLVAQPSSLLPGQLDNLMDAIKAGIPTAVFEDPFPWQFNGQRDPAVPGTDEPKSNPAAMMGMRQPPPEKCDIQQLWDLLGVHMVKAKQSRPVTRSEFLESDRSSADREVFEVDMGGRRLIVRSNAKEKSLEVRMRWELFTPVVWQHYNPYLQDPNIPDFAVFANQYSPGGADTFNPDEPVVAGMHEVLFMGPGAFERAEKPKAAAKGLTFTPLVTLGTETGLRAMRPVVPPGIKVVESQSEALPGANAKPDDRWIDRNQLLHLTTEQRAQTEQRYIMAARVKGQLDSKKQQPGEDESTDAAGPAEDAAESKKTADKEGDSKEVNVILVSDIDTLSELFFLMRSRPPEGVIPFRFQNISFVLNLIDDLAGDDRFIGIRKRARHHATLRLIEDRYREAEELGKVEREKYEQQQHEEVEKKLAEDQEIERRLLEKVETAKAEGKLDGHAVDDLQESYDWQVKQNQQARQNELNRNQRQLADRLNEIERGLQIERNSIQATYKLWAVILPPIPPLLIGFAVWIRRMMRESEGVAETRRK